ncbi:MAG: glutamate racemase [Bacteroidetes bacterium]|nr:glutamate racemase [Bacteroidota bacterium]
MNSISPIGIFDSGIGGVSVLRAVRELLPNENIIYFGDSANLPYGEKTMEQIRVLSERVVKFLLEKKCRIIVIACNTASAAALKYLREKHPGVLFVGMEPAVKPAAEQTQTGVVGVIATTATFQGELFASVVERFAQNVKVINQPCPGLVQQIENGELDSPATEKMLRGWLEPMKEKNIDALVLACTHYPFVRPLIEKILGDKVRVIDPAPAIAKQVKKILEESGGRRSEGGEEKQLSVPVVRGETIYCTSGDPQKFNDIFLKLTGKNADVVMKPQLD